MNLKFYLIIRIVLIAFICLLATAAYVLYQSDRKSRHGVLESAEAIDRQLEFQLLRIAVGAEIQERFPDINVWSENEFEPGRCARFVSANGDLNNNACRGEISADRSWPLWFERFYRWTFNPGKAVVQQVTFRNRNYGTITVSNSAGNETERAWHDVATLMSLTIVTVASVCILVFVSVSQALQPAKTIVAGLQRMEGGDLSLRLPYFEVSEWQSTGEAINRLVANQEKLLSERKELALKLMDVQEAERRYLVRELHDEFGQCLAGLNAVASSICQTATDECPGLVSEGRNVERITRHMMDLLRSMLLRLRPSDIDKLGLEAGLKTLVAGWNAHGNIRYELAVQGNFDRLPESIPANIYRIVQECLTNISKHSSAAHAKIELERSEPKRMNGFVEHITLLIEDDGITDSLSFANTSGTGLLGIRERVTALAGTLVLKARSPNGLAVHVRIPLQPIPETGK